MFENLSWNGPFQINDPIPYELRGKTGVYKVKYNSETLYVGQSKTSAHKRAKDHFRGQGDSTGRWILEHSLKSQLRIWVTPIEDQNMIDITEKGLIQKLNPIANVNLVNP